MREIVDRHFADNYLALCVSVSLAMLFFCCVILKVKTLTETEEVSAVLSPELRSVFDMPVVVLTAILLVCTLGTLGFSSVLRSRRVRLQGESGFSSMATTACMHDVSGAGAHTGWRLR